MDDLGLNKYLRDTYGSTFDGQPLFRLIWSTNVTEKRYSEFSDFSGDIFIRTVREVREVLKYPFAQDRWILEKIEPITEGARLMGLVDGNWTYEGIYVFQDRNSEFLPLNFLALEAAMYCYFKFYLQMTPLDKIDMHTKALAEKVMKTKQKTKEALGEGRSPLFFVLE